MLYLAGCTSPSQHDELTNSNLVQLVCPPLNLCQKQVDIVTPLLSGLKDGLTLVEEEDCIVDFGLAENEFEVFSCGHTAQRWEIDEENLWTIIIL